MGVTGEASDWLSEVGWDLGVSVELPDEDGSVSGGGDEDLSVFVFLLWVAGFNGGNPVAMTFEVTDFSGCDLTFNFSHWL